MTNGQILIPATVIKVTSWMHSDLGNSELLCGIDISSGIAVGKCWKITPAGIISLLIQTTSGGKDDSITGYVLPNGTAKIRVSEADVAGSGSTSAIRHYEVIGAFPVAQSSASGTSDPGLRAYVKGLLVAIRDLLNVWINKVI